MKKILIAFLGNAQYQETIYQIEDKQYKDQLAFIPIYKHFSPVETAYVIGTKESRWELLENFPHKRIEIPYGRSETDFWEMFDILTRDLKLKNTEVVFDITHCFRAIPLFAVIYIRFLKYVEPTAKFIHIFYGSFEKTYDITPIVDLASTLELLDWIDATTSFIKYGELEDLSLRIKETNDRIWKSGIDSKPKMLGEFSKRLEGLSHLSRLTYIPLLPDTSKEMSDLMNRKEFNDEILRFVKPFSLLTDSLVKYTTRFARPSIWESHLEAAKFYLENKRPTQSLLVLRETILTRLCEKDGCDPYDIESREERENELNEQRRMSKKPLVKLWGKITDARNRAGHALMKRPSKDLSPQKAIMKVGHLIKETEDILGGKLD
ncbi:MAG: TM1812 family CRISPR-associated protein [Thermodesulfobacteriota bacterium]